MPRRGLRDRDPGVPHGLPHRADEDAGALARRRPEHGPALRRHDDDVEPGAHRRRRRRPVRRLQRRGPARVLDGQRQRRRRRQGRRCADRAAGRPAPGQLQDRPEGRRRVLRPVRRLGDLHGGGRPRRRAHRRGVRARAAEPQPARHAPRRRHERQQEPHQLEPPVDLPAEGHRRGAVRARRGGHHQRDDRPVPPRRRLPRLRGRLPRAGWPGRPVPRARSGGSSTTARRPRSRSVSPTRSPATSPAAFSNVLTGIGSQIFCLFGTSESKDVNSGHPAPRYGTSRGVEDGPGPNGDNSSGTPPPVSDPAAERQNVTIAANTVRCGAIEAKKLTVNAGRHGDRRQGPRSDGSHGSPAGFIDPGTATR